MATAEGFWKVLRSYESNQSTWPTCETCRKKVDHVRISSGTEALVFSCHGEEESVTYDSYALRVKVPQFVFRRPWRGFEGYTIRPARTEGRRV